MCSNLHTQVRHAAGDKRIWINVFMAGQKWKEQKCTAFFNGILQTVAVLLQLAGNSKALLSVNWIIYSVTIWSELYFHVNTNSETYVHV